MRWTVWIVLALAAACQGQTADPRLDTHITFHGGCVPLGELVPKLGKSVGVSMSVSCAARDLMAFVRVKDRPLREVMSQIAKTFDLTWSHDALDKVPRYVLEQTMAQKRKAESATLEAKKKEIETYKAFVKKYAEGMKAPETERRKLADEWEGSQVFGQFDPEANKQPGRMYSALQNDDVRMAIDFLSGWSDDDWMRLLDEESLVFSTSPTPAQVKLPDKYLAKAGQWQSEAKAYHAKPQKSRYIYYNAEPIAPGKSYETDAAAIMKLQISVEGGNVIEKGTVLDAARDVLMQGHEWYSNASTYRPEQPAVRAYSDDPIFGKPYRAPERLLRMRTRDAAVDAYEAWDASHGPDDFLEPDDVVIGPWLSDVSDKFGVDMVVNLRWVNGWLPEKEKPLGEVLRSCSYATKFDAAGGWLRAKAAPTAYEYAPLPRRVLRKVYSMFHDGACPTLDQFAEIAASLDDKQCLSLFSTLQDMYRGLDVNFLGWPDCCALLRFWATVLPQQRDAFLSGEAVSVRDLTSGQRRDLWLALRKKTSRGLSFDWTEEMPLGLPPGMTFAITLDESKIGYVASVRTNDWMMGMPESDHRDFQIVPDAAELWRYAAGTDHPVAQFYKGGMWQFFCGFTIRQGVDCLAGLEARRVAGKVAADAATDKELAKLLEEGLKQIKESEKKKDDAKPPTDR